MNNNTVFHGISQYLSLHIESCEAYLPTMFRIHYYDIMILEQKYTDIGKCIYCNKMNLPLTDEHVIPLSLAGTMVLKNASCEECRKITSKYERNPIHENWIEARACLDYPSRRSKFKDMTFDMDVVLKDDTPATLQLSKDETLGITLFPEFPLPAFFGNANYTHGAVWVALRTIGFGKIDLKEFSDKYNIKQIIGSVKYKGNHFEIMIARIAYCAVIAYLGPNALKKNFVLPTILGEIDDVGYWLGCDYEGKIVPHMGKVPASNVIGLGLLSRVDGTKCLMVSIKFFAASDAPEYIVVVGEPTPEAMEVLKQLNSSR